jgi:hypothetical protein
MKLDTQKKGSASNAAVIAGRSYEFRGIHSPWEHAYSLLSLLARDFFKYGKI